MQTSSTSGLAIIRRIRINEAWIPLRDCRETRAADTRDDAPPG